MCVRVWVCVIFSTFLLNIIYLLIILRITNFRRRHVFYLLTSVDCPLIVVKRVSPTVGTGWRGAGAARALLFYWKALRLRRAPAAAVQATSFFYISHDDDLNLHFILPSFPYYIIT